MGGVTFAIEHGFAFFVFMVTRGGCPFIGYGDFEIIALRGIRNLSGSNLVTTLARLGLSRARACALQTTRAR